MKELIAKLEDWVTHPDNEFSTDEVKEAFFTLSQAVMKFEKKYS